jgi:chromosome segregation ATPase
MASTPQRGWLEGTLDVISGMAHRPSTPTPSQYRSGVMSAPTSPMRKDREMVIPAIHRLPSQDSIDRSIHNDSGHGKKSTAQIIRDLKQSNARLTARTAALEADFMNQLNETTRQYEEKQQKLEETILRSEKLTSSLEHRCQLAETKLKERDESLQRTKEESAFQRHTISDLRTQLDWTENHETSDDWKDEKDMLNREVNLLKEQVKAEAAEKEQLQEQMTAIRQGEGSKSLAERLRQTQATLDQVREDGEKQQVEHQRQVSCMQEKLDHVQHGPSPFELTEKEEKEADAPSLQQQLLEVTGSTGALRKELDQAKTQAEHQERYRQEEADDLRLLNDAQEEEIQRLRMEMEEALKEVDIREQELEERYRELRDPGGDGLEESQKNLAQLELDFAEFKNAKEKEITELTDHMNNLENENDKLHQNSLHLKASSSEEDFTMETVLALRARNITLEQKSSNLERANDELKSHLEVAENSHRDSPVDSQEQQERLESDYQAQLIAKDTELAKLSETVKAAKRKADQDTSRIIQMTAEIKELNAKLGDANDTDPREASWEQSGGEYEEDLRKEVANLREDRSELRQKLEVLEDDMESTEASLRAKLSDRDTTISALVKSNVSLESEVSSARIELELFRARLSRFRDNDDTEEGVDVILARSEEVSQLRDSLAAYKETESRTSQEIIRVEKEIFQVKKENARLRRLKTDAFDDAASASGSFISASPHQVKERDEAIARLVKQTVTQDKEIRSLQFQMDSLSRELQDARGYRSPQSSPTEMELEQLRQESEMFAGQVIELDEEIENLRNALAERDHQLANLEKELGTARKIVPANFAMEKEKDDKIAALMSEANELKSRPMADGSEFDRIRTLEAEVDELREANSEQMSEVRQLRRLSRNARSAADEIAVTKGETAEAQSKVDELRKIVDNFSLESESLKRELEEARTGSADSTDAKLRNLRDKLSDKDWEIAQLKADGARSPSPGPPDEIDEFEGESMKEEMVRLRHTLEGQSQDLDNAKDTIRELERMVAEKTEDAMAQWEEEKEELMADMEDLTLQLDQARESLDLLDKEKHLIEDFKQKLEEADEEREQSEKTIVDTYERKLSLLTLDKDVTIDKIRKELVTAKEGSSKSEEELISEIEEYQANLTELKEQATAEIQMRDTRIYALENTLDASKQLVGNMRTEMDHLQGSMVNAVAGRKDEIEDMQQEIVDLTATTARQEREMSALRMKLEEKHLAHQAEVAKFHETIAKLENHKAGFEGHRNAHDLQMDLRVREVKEKLDKLKWRNQSLQEENESLRQRVAKLETNSKADFVERGKYEKLRGDLSEQKQQMKELQVALEEARSVVVTPAPALPPGSADRKTKKRMGLFGKRRGATEDTQTGALI